MKKILIILLCLLCTFGCTKKGDDSLKGNINIKEATGKDNRLIYFINNKNKENIDLIIKTIFYDKDKNKISEDESIINAVTPNHEIVYQLFKTPNNYDSKTIEIIPNISKYQDTYENDINLEIHNAESNYEVYVTNNSKFTLNELSISFVYYQNNEVVGVSTNNLNNLYSKDTTKIKISHPYNEKYEEIPYDNYKTYINTAY